ncbi:MAG: hypothetical protein GEU26_12775 [Nitrososphaeraceae archaeon]|nr:hypothetical protein [Nitrososphaeraceae archaeon]
MYRNSNSKPVIFVVISVLVVALVYSSISAFYVFAVPSDPKFGGDCKFTGPPPVRSCCWRELVPEGTGNPDLGGYQEEYCQTCNLDQNGDPTTCSQKELQFFEGRLPERTAPLQDGVLEQPPTPPSSDPAAPLQDGVLEQPPSEGVAPPVTRGQGVLPQDGVLQQEPTDEGTGATPRTVEPPTEDETTQPTQEPLPCPEGQILDEESGLCVLEEEQPGEQESEQTEGSEENGSDENGNEDNNSDN